MRLMPRNFPAGSCIATAVPALCSATVVETCPQSNKSTRGKLRDDSDPKRVEKIVEALKIAGNKALTELQKQELLSL